MEMDSGPGAGRRGRVRADGDARSKTGYITIPGSQNPDHILEKYSIFDFELTDEEMQRMAELHTGQRYENW